MDLYRQYRLLEKESVCKEEMTIHEFYLIRGNILRLLFKGQGLEQYLLLAIYTSGWNMELGD